MPRSPIRIARGRCVLRLAQTNWSDVFAGGPGARARHRGELPHEGGHRRPRRAGTGERALLNLGHFRPRARGRGRLLEPLHGEAISSAWRSPSHSPPVGTFARRRGRARSSAILPRSACRSMFPPLPAAHWRSTAHSGAHCPGQEGPARRPSWRGVGSSFIAHGVDTAGARLSVEARPAMSSYDWPPSRRCACSAVLLLRGKRDGVDRVLAREHAPAREARGSARGDRQSSARRARTDDRRAAVRQQCRRRPPRSPPASCSPGSACGVIYATVVMTVLIMVFAEVLPKTPPSTWRACRVGWRRPPDRLDGAPAGARAGRGRVAGAAPAAAAGMNVGERIDPVAEAAGGRSLAPRGGVERLDRDMLSGLLDLRDLTVST